MRSVVEGGSTQAAAADLFNTSPKTVAKWVKRFRGEGLRTWSILGLRDFVVQVDECTGVSLWVPTEV